MSFSNGWEGTSLCWLHCVQHCVINVDLHHFTPLYIIIIYYTHQNIRTKQTTNFKTGESHPIITEVTVLLLKLSSFAENRVSMRKAATHSILS